MPLGAPAAAAFAGGYVADVLGGGRATVLGTFLLVMAVVFAMNWFGLRISGRVQLILAGTLAALLLITVVTALPHARLANLRPFAPHGWAGIGAAAAILVWGFAGWEAVSSLSGEYRDPRRDVPRATAIAVVVVGVLYLAVAATSVLVLGPALGASPAPLADLLAVGVGGPVRAITAVVAVLLTIGAVNAYLAGASRLGVALARDGALPARMVGTPRQSLIFVTVGGLASVLLPIDLHTVMLLVTGCFTLVYVLGTAAALRLLPAGRSRVVAGRRVRRGGRSALAERRARAAQPRLRGRRRRLPGLAAPRRPDGASNQAERRPQAKHGARAERSAQPERRPLAKPGARRSATPRRRSPAPRRSATGRRRRTRTRSRSAPSPRRHRQARRRPRTSPGRPAPRRRGRRRDHPPGPRRIAVAEQGGDVQPGRGRHHAPARPRRPSSVATIRACRPAYALPASPDVPGQLPLVDEPGQRRLHRDLAVPVAELPGRHQRRSQRCRGASTNPVRTVGSMVLENVPT